ncbi:MAG: trypsin-like peptidase domain-containing protein [Gammaproteobacteria bacterium]|nr:trypsin-like peptidase domain-containing protein [Gammaproteobacteria bacterium]
MKIFAYSILVFITISISTGIHAREEPAVLCEKTTIELFNILSPAVVFILGMSIDPYEEQDRVKWAIGSGVLIDEKGHILTNSHVVLELDEVSIALEQDKVVTAEVLGADPILDLAVIKIAGSPDNISVAKMGDSDALQIGEDVIAIGNPMGFEKTVSKGIITGLNRTLPSGPMSWLVPYIQTDAALSPGNSGGPLVNRCGEVIGINSATLEEGENIGFAVPINLAKHALPELIEHGRVRRPWHGINGKMLDFSLVMLINYPLRPGFLIETIEPDSAADQAGLHAGVLPLQIGMQEYILGGDIITKVNGESITSAGVLLRIVNSLKVGDTVEVEYFREGEINTIKVTLPERPLLPGDRSN